MDHNRAEKAVYTPAMMSCRIEIDEKNRVQVIIIK
jgi:hypothetical protein